MAQKPSNLLFLKENSEIIIIIKKNSEGKPEEEIKIWNNINAIMHRNSVFFEQKHRYKDILQDSAMMEWTTGFWIGCVNRTTIL